jgi:hypothetical protein
MLISAWVSPLITIATSARSREPCVCGVTGAPRHVLHCCTGYLLLDIAVRGLSFHIFLRILFPLFTKAADLPRRLNKLGLQYRMLSTPNTKGVPTTSPRHGCRCHQRRTLSSSSLLDSPRQGTTLSCHCRFAGLNRAVDLLAKSVYTWKAPSLLRHR